MHTNPTCNPRGCAYRLRDMTDWQALQGVMPVYRKALRISALGRFRIGSEHQIHALEQIADLFTRGAVDRKLRRVLAMQ